MASCTTTRVSLFRQVLRIMSRMLSVARVDSPAIKNRKSGLVSRRGATLKVISADDQTVRSRRVRRWSSDRLYIRNVCGGRAFCLTFACGRGPATAACWAFVISAAALKIFLCMSSCRYNLLTSFLNGIAASLPSGKLSHSSITLRSIKSKIAVGLASCIFSIGALLYLSMGSHIAFLATVARLTRSLLVVTIERSSGRGGSILGVLFPGMGLVGNSGRWMRGCIGCGPSTSIAGVAGVLWSGQSGLTGASRFV